MFTKPDARPDFNQLELATLSWWKEKNILDRSIQARPNTKIKTFYDGPITANGEPHNGHMLTFAMKDIMPRYWTMKGFQVSRSLGWDCQGLPVETEVEKELGLKQKSDIEAYGIDKFNALCRQAVLRFMDKIIVLEERMGRLTNADEEYFTMDSKYIESIWWSLKQLHDKGLLYEGFKVVPYSTRAGTTLSNAEVALGGYKPFTDPAVTVKFPLRDEPNTVLLAWTTTPWTLPTNFGLAVGKEIKYIKVQRPSDNTTYIVAAELADSIFGVEAYTNLGEIAASALVDRSYQPLFDYFLDKPNAFRIHFGAHVTTDSGTGIVHLAPYGAEDADIFKEVGVEMLDVLNDQGDFTDQIPDLAGQNYRAANPLIIEKLTQSGRLFAQADYLHDMPMCWRTNTPLIYKPVTSWYIAMSTLRAELVTNNDKINWTPAHVKDGRFGNWLAEIKDWGISRSRYWGTPLPIWKSASGKVKIFGNFAEVEALTGKKIDDPHRPYVDDLDFEFEGETYKRIPDVLDVWYDSGAMPFARFHYPFENQDKFAAKFPAQYIAESVDQTRGWFYSLHAVATALFSSEAYQNVVMSGFTLDDHGAKQSKSKKNYDPPQVLIDRFGADAIRLNFFNSPISAGEDTTVSEKTVKTQIQEFILPLWNSFSYLVTYANIHNWEPRVELAYNSRHNSSAEHPWDHIPFGDMQNELDGWILAQLQTTIQEVNNAMDSYQFPRATRALYAFVNELSKWYIRRSRSRFAAGEERALETLYYVMVEFSKLTAPFMPFLSEYIYKVLVVEQVNEQQESVHLTDYPEADTNFMAEHAAILQEMQTVRQIAEMGQTIRSEHALKVRQPLAKLEVKFSRQDNEHGSYLSTWMADIIAQELNILEVVEVATLSSNEGMLAAADGNGVDIAIDSVLTPELEAAGLTREIIRALQALRKQAGLQMGEAVNITYQTESAKLQGIITARQAEIMQAITATELVAGEGETEIVINEESMRVSLRK